VKHFKVKDGLLSAVIFNLVPFSKEFNEITVLNFFGLGWTVEDSNFVHFFEDGTKLKMGTLENTFWD
jgi:hypothetical protein